MNMTFIGDLVPTTANEFRVKTVAKNECVWKTHSTYSKRIDALDCIESLIKSGDYRIIGIEPHNSEFGIFQSHALQHVWEG